MLVIQCTCSVYGNKFYSHTQCVPEMRLFTSDTVHMPQVAPNIQEIKQKLLKVGIVVFSRVALH